jgi:uncharacterized damage-inducible protein DinB
LFGLLLSQALFADSNSVIVSSLAKHWQSSKELTLAVAEAMPEDGYAFKATDAEMSFGEQINHIAAGNYNYCSAAIGEKNPMAKPADNTKSTAVKNVTAAFDYCIAGIQKMTDADLEKTITRGSGTVSKFELFWGGFTHTAHHRGQTEVYLRLKGIKPPDYKF